MPVGAPPPGHPTTTPSTRLPRIGRPGPTGCGPIARERRWLGNAVRELRTRRMLSQEALAFRCGLHRNYVGAIERGEVNTTFRTIVALVDGLEISLSELVAIYERRRSEADAAR